MKQSLFVLSLGALLLVGCGSDDKKDDQPNNGACPEGADAGAEIACSCGDAGMTGTAICQANGQPGLCDCDGAGGAGGMSGGSGGSGGSPVGGSGGSGGTGGSGGSGDDEDGGMEPGDGDGDASVPPIVLPDDGNQGSVCVDDRDCNRDLGCYNAGGAGQGFCSAVCEMDADCEAIAGASYICSMSTNVCIIECEGEDDTESCPEPMVCVNVTGGGGGGGMASYRCKYPEAGEEPGGDGDGDGAGALLDECSGFGPGPGGGAGCGDGLVCTPTGPGTGYCTAECELPDGDCSALEEAAGDLTPECTTLGGPGGGSGQCTLDCSENEDGCPEGMTCIQFGPTMRCGY